jgi:hypothetical protein
MFGQKKVRFSVNEYYYISVHVPVLRQLINVSHIYKRREFIKLYIDKRMVRFQKLFENVFLSLNRHNIHCQQREQS